jgi:hypothetical protein
MNLGPVSSVVQGTISHQPNPSDASDEEWSFVVPYLCLLPEEASQRVHGFRDVLVMFDDSWLAVPDDSHPAKQGLKPAVARALVSTTVLAMTTLRVSGAPRQTRDAFAKGTGMNAHSEQG